MQRKHPLTADTAPAAARRWLARRDYSQHELCQRLQREGLTPLEAERLSAELADGWWQDDARFAATRVRARARQGKGPRVIAAELAGHGFSEADIRAAEAEADVDWREAAAEALRRSSHADPNRQRQVLLRKGFTAEQIRQALERE